MMKSIVLVAVFFVMGLTFGQEKEEPKGLSAEAQANNPLADIKAFNVQFSYLALNTTTDAQTMMANIRYAQPIWRFLIRATVPVITTTSREFQSSIAGLGDINLFATYLLSQPTSSNQFGIGPMVNFPTAVSRTSGGNYFDNTSLGANNWQVGAAFIAFFASSPKFQGGGLVTWQYGVGEDKLDPNQDPENLMAVQPFYFLQLGKGTYLRGAPIWTLNFRDNAYNFPIGIGIGQVVKAGGTVFNMFVEPQFSVFSSGENQSMFQLFASINLQFVGKGKK